MFAFDVFEHMTQDEVCTALQSIKPIDLIVRIPLACFDHGKFVLEISENDKTHVTRLTRASWLKLFSGCGYAHLFNINLGLLYDSTGVMCAMFRRRDRV